MTANYALTLLQGTTCRTLFRYAQPTAVAVAVAVAAATSPALITTATDHGLPTDPWPVQLWVTPPRGCGLTLWRPVDVEAQACQAVTLLATRTGTDTLTVPVSALTASPFPLPAELRFFPPVDLTDYTARMQVRAAIDSDIVLLALSTDDGTIEVEVEGRVTLVVPPELTAGAIWRTGVYDLELISPTGEVIRLVGGPVTLVPEVTRAA